MTVTTDITLRLSQDSLKLLTTELVPNFGITLDEIEPGVYRLIMLANPDSFEEHPSLTVLDEAESDRIRSERGQ